MTNNQILDAILHCYLFAQKMKLENNAKYSKMTFEFIFNAQTKDQAVESWQMEFLKQTLINDGFIKLPETGVEPFELTPSGVKAAQLGWYKKNERDLETEIQINSLTIKDLKRSKTSLTIALLAVIIPTILSVYSLVQSANSNKDKEIDKLKTDLNDAKKEIDEIKKELILLKK